MKKTVSVVLLTILLTSGILTFISLVVPVTAIWVWELPIPYVRLASEVTVDGEIYEEAWSYAAHFHNYSTHEKTIEFDAYLMHDGFSMYAGVVIHDNDFWSTYSVLGDAFQVEINDRNDGHYGGDSGNDVKLIIVTNTGPGMYYDMYIPGGQTLDTVIDGEGAFTFSGMRQNGEVGNYCFELKIPINGSHPEDASLHIETSFGMMVSFVDYDPDENVGYGYWILQGSFVLKSWAGGPVYIRADGSIDPPDAPIITTDKTTYTLTDDIASNADGIIIERDNIILDGAGHTITGNNTSTGISLNNRHNVIIKNTQIKNFNSGVSMGGSSYNTISENNITNNRSGIDIYGSSYNTISGNNITNNYCGVQMGYSSNNTFSGNIFVADGLIVFESYGNVVVDNFVNGKPLVYLEGMSDVVVEDAGQVVLVNCNRITIQNLNINNTSIAVQLLKTNNSVVRNNKITNNLGGVCIYGSSYYNTIIGNKITNNYFDGINIYDSSSRYNAVSGNKITNNGCGVNIYGSSYNAVSGNKITNNGCGVGITGPYNIISGNNITNNTLFGVVLYSSSYGSSYGNIIYHNIFVGNSYQVLVSSGSNVWDEGYPGGGNYWSDYTGVDYYCGPGQDQPGSDGIGDAPYVINVDNVDRYPLMVPWTPKLTVESVNAWRWVSDTDVLSVGFGDVDGDGQAEVVTGGYFNDGACDVAQLVVWDGCLTVPEDIRAWCWTGDTRVNAVAVGDVNDDGWAEIVTGGYFFDGFRKVAQLVVWDGLTLNVEGLQVWYWTGDTEINAVAVADVEGDGKKEIVTGGYYNDGVRDVAQLVVWSGQDLALENLAVWYWTGNTHINALAVDNVDADAQMEVVTGGYYFDSFRKVAQLIVWDGSTLSVEGVRVWYWTGSTEINAVSIGDVDFDGQMEIVTGGYYNDGFRDVAQLVVWNAQGLAPENYAVWYWTGNTRISAVGVGDADFDGQMEIVTGGYYNDGFRDVAQLAVWNSPTLSPKHIAVWYWTDKTRISATLLGNVDSDLHPEIVTGGSYSDGAFNYAQTTKWQIK